MTVSSPVSTTAITDIASIDLDDWGSLPEATDAPMATAGKKLWAGEGILEVGLWRCEPGPSRWVLETNESITVISGRVTVTEDGGETHVITAGDSAVFPKGWTGVWDIEETIFKIYTAF